MGRKTRVPPPSTYYRTRHYLDLLAKVEIIAN